MFQKEIAQIFQRKCFQCHTDGNISMSLTTYKDARPWAVAIKEEILERRMPPWSAVNGYGHFANDMSLTAREVSIILAWADGGAPSGVLLADESKEPVFVPPLNGWEQGTPDAVVNVAKDQKVAAGSPDRTARFEVASGLDSIEVAARAATESGRSARHSLRRDLRGGVRAVAWNVDAEHSGEQPAGRRRDPLAGEGETRSRNRLPRNRRTGVGCRGARALFFSETSAASSDGRSRFRRRQSASRRARRAKRSAPKPC